MRSRPPGPAATISATKYTRRHHREFWTPALLDHSMHDRWASEGATTLGQRVRARVAVLLAEDRDFTLAAEQAAGLEAILAAALADEGARV